MTSIEELREKIFAVPQTFASGAGSGEVATFPTEGSDTDTFTSFQNGFPQRFAKDPTTASGAYILRTDMNKFGELATSELHYKEAGAKHKFEDDLKNSIYGYPLMCLFGHYDGEYLKSIESQVKENRMNFTTTPLCIDNLAAIGTSSEKKVYWRTANKIYGLDEDLFRIEVDYSRVDKLQSGTELAEDSLIVIGDYGYPGESKTITPAAASLILTIGSTTFTLQNKGKCGIRVKQGKPNKKWNEEVLIQNNIPYPDQMCGYGNSTLVFYAKAGTSVSYKFSDGQTQKSGTNVFAFPVKLGVGKATDND